MRRDAEAPPWNIVLAEDDEDHGLLIRIALEHASRRPVELTWVRDGESAIRAVEERNPDLLLLDLNLPSLSGHEVLERVKGDDRLCRVPVAVLTSSDRDEDIARSYGLGSSHFITKPGNPAELARRLGTLLDQLPELSGVRRGKGAIEATAVSDLRPPFLSLRSEVLWAVLLVLVAALVAYFIVFG